MPLSPLERAILKANRAQYPGKPVVAPTDWAGALALDIQREAPDLGPVAREALLVPGRKFRCDLYLPRHRIVVEIDGGIWIRGRTGRGGAHSLPTNILRDMEKGNLLTALGYRVFRFTPQMVKSREAHKFLMSVIGVKK